MSMMLLGKCPKCGGQDTICQFCQGADNPADLYKARCNVCSTLWGDWTVLMREEGRRSNKLIPIQIERVHSRDGQEWGVKLAWLGINEIPFYGLIVGVLNAALMARYNLKLSLHSKGCIEGCYKGSNLELLNDSGLLGLYVVKSGPRRKEVGKILDFYHLMLHYLFEAGPFGTGQYRRGEILRLSQNGEARAWEILITVLSTTRSKGFSREVSRIWRGTDSREQ